MYKQNVEFSILKIMKIYYNSAVEKLYFNSYFNISK